MMCENPPSFVVTRTVQVILKIKKRKTHLLKNTSFVVLKYQTDESLSVSGLTLTISQNSFLEEAAVLQVVFDDYISDSIEHKLHVLGVGSAGEVGVDLLGLLLFVQVLEFGPDVILSLLVLVGA